MNLDKYLIMYISNIELDRVLLLFRPTFCYAVRLYKTVPCGFGAA